MPEARLARARLSLPEGYQFGDASDGARVILLEPDEFIVGTLPLNVTVQYAPGNGSYNRYQHGRWSA